MDRDDELQQLAALSVHLTLSVLFISVYGTMTARLFLKRFDFPGEV